MTDKEIMLSVRGGDIDRLGVLFERHHLRLYNFMLRLTANPQESEDLVQDIFMRMLRYRESYNGDGTFTTWLYRIAYNCFYDYRKRAGAQNLADDDLERLPVSADQVDAIIRKEESDLLNSALQELNETDRAILIMSAYRQMKYREIAEVLGCTVGTIKTRVFRAVRKLRKILKDYN